MTDTKWVNVPTHTIQYEGNLNEVVLSWQTFALTIPEEHRNEATVSLSYGDDFLEIDCSYTRPKTDEEKLQDAAVAAASKAHMLEYYKKKVEELESSLGATGSVGIVG